MSTITFNPEKHLSAADQERLKKLADEAGMTVADFIELTLKRAIFAPPATLQPEQTAA